MRKKLQEAAKSGRPVDGKVVAIVRGGYEVSMEGVIGFCPFSQIDTKRIIDQLAFLHQTYPFRVTSIARGGRRVVLSRRRCLEAEVRKAQAQARRSVKPGATHQGTVTSLTDFGAFVEIEPGVRGMVHVSEISHERMAKPADRLKVGDKVKVKVLKPGGHKGRISLSMKALEQDPWDAARERIKIHQVMTGRVMRVTEFGVFVELAPGVDGLIHVSELSNGSLEDFRTKAESREGTLVQVLNVENGKKRVSLAPAPEGKKAGDLVKPQTVRPGTVVTGQVESVTPAGVMVRLGPGQVGLIPPVETGTTRGADLQKAFPAGKEVTVLVMAADRGRGNDRGRGGSDRGRLRLSIRKAVRKQEKEQLDEYRKSAASGAGGSLATLGDFFRQG